MPKPKKPRTAPAAAKKKTSGGPGKSLNIVVPPETLVALKTTAAQTSSTVRAVILAALHGAGHPVPEKELMDRRRKA